MTVERGGGRSSGPAKSGKGWPETFMWRRPPARGSKPACEIAGIDLHTLQRWRAADGLIRGDGRPQAVRPLPGHALSEAERARLLAVANAPRFRPHEYRFRLGWRKLQVLHQRLTP